MADNVQLNKPLYKSDDEEGFTPPIPRQPRASLLGRGGAIFLDVMLLHLLFGVIVRLVPVVPLTLGPLAPWVGLLIGFFYFAFGFSNITLGRTFGKLITRVQVADIAGPDLPLSRAMLRAALLLWPLPVQLILRTIAENAADSNPANPVVTIEILGTMLIIGWVLGNLAFAGFDPYYRTVYDRLSKSIVINAELEPAAVKDYLVAAREADRRPPMKRSVTVLGITLALCMAFAVASVVNAMRQIKDLSDDERDRIQMLVLEGYGRAVPAEPIEDTVTTGIPAVGFQFRKRGFLDVEAIKSDVPTTETLDRLITAATGPEFIRNAQDYISSLNLERGKKGELPVNVPDSVQFQMSFVEYADMFFAKSAHPVFTLSRSIEIPTTATLAADGKTTTP